MSERIPARPDIKVIDRAIALVRGPSLAGDYSCWALKFAATRSIYGRHTEYERQFCLWASTLDSLPWWWSCDPGLHKRARVGVLRKFRQACIDAAAPIPSQGTEGA